MAKKASKPAKSNELDGKEFFTAIELIEKEKGIPENYMLEKITQALISAYKRDHEGDRRQRHRGGQRDYPDRPHVRARRRSWKRSTNPATEIALEEARKRLPRRTRLGDVVRIEIKTAELRPASPPETARQVIIQGMREAEHGMIYDEFSSKEHEILTGTVTRIDPRNGCASLCSISSGNGSPPRPMLAPTEQVRGEVLSGRATG